MGGTDVWVISAGTLGLLVRHPSIANARIKVQVVAASRILQSSLIGLQCYVNDKCAIKD